MADTWRPLILRSPIHSFIILARECTIFRAKFAKSLLKSAYFHRWKVSWFSKWRQSQTWRFQRRFRLNFVWIEENFRDFLSFRITFHRLPIFYPFLSIIIQFFAILTRGERLAAPTRAARWKLHSKLHIMSWKSAILSQGQILQILIRTCTS